MDPTTHTWVPSMTNNKQMLTFIEIVSFCELWWDFQELGFDTYLFLYDAAYFLGRRWV